MSRRKPIRIECVCKQCEKPFSVLPSEQKDGRRFCSQRCAFENRKIPLSERFWRYVGGRTSRGCIIWCGHKNLDGYGLIRDTIGPCKQGNILAHRLAYQIFRGPIPDDMRVLHKCDNPACVNPYHLFLGTQLDNVTDMIKKGRGRKGEKHGNAKLTNANVIFARRRYSAGGISQQKLAEILGVSQATLWRAIRGRTWKHVS